MEIIKPNQTASAVLTIPLGKQLTLVAQGLGEGDAAYVELVTLSSQAEFTGNPCCDTTTGLEVVASTRLRCPNGAPVRMTQDSPYVVLDAPQNVALRVVIEADTSAAVSVTKHETDSSGCMACTCPTETLPPEPVVTYCPSQPLSCDGSVPGYGFHQADPPDPEATVVMDSCDGSVDPIFIYPTAGTGHTIRVTDCTGALIGYAANRSDCAA